MATGPTGQKLLLAAAGIVTLAASTAPHLRAQATADTRPPAFEVASVKPNKSGTGPFSFQIQAGGRFTATNVPLRELIRVAYGIQNIQLVGGPTWIRSERFDILAKAEGDLLPSPSGGLPNRTLMMIRSLLAERFGLATHNETRELPIHSLVMASADRRLGPQLRQSTADCDVVLAARGRSWATPPTPPPLGERPRCDLFAGFGRFAAGGVAMSRLATNLSPQVNRIVVDGTRLAGLFDFDLQWTPDLLLQLQGGAAPTNKPIRMNGVDFDPNGPSLSTALQEQLGLKLESSKGPVDVLVIDRVEQPTPD